MSSFLQDLRYGIRVLMKKPGFSLIAIITLALGIGANTAMFSILNAVVLRPLPYPEPDKIVECYWQLEEIEMSAVTSLVFEFWRDHTQSFESIAGYANINSGFNLSGGAEPERVRGLHISEGFFRVIGTGPRTGRGFLPEEDIPKGPRVVIVSDSLWRGYFGGDPNMVGRDVAINGQSYNVVGILPPDFQFNTPVDVLFPLQIKGDVRDDGQNTGMIARLKPEVSTEQAQAEVAQLISAFRDEYPTHLKQGERGMRLVSYQESIVGDVSTTLWLLFAAVGFVLLIACANVASLMFARASGRKGETAVRIALGASKWRLIRQLLTESWLLALAGSFAGLLLASWAVPALLALAPAGLPRINEIGIDYQTAVFTVGVSILTSLLFGLAPAWQSTKFNVYEAIKSSTGKNAIGSDSRMQNLLVVGEIALAVVLLIGASLIIRSFVNLRGVNTGFDSRHLTTAQVSLASDQYKKTAQVWSFEQRVIERLSSSPGVVAVATASNLPLERGLRVGMMINGQQIQQSIQVRAISPQYFTALGMSVLQGRATTDADTQSSPPVVLVNQALARIYMPDREPLGSQVRMQGKDREVVGVVNDIKEMGLDKAVEPTVYVPRPQISDGMTALMNHWFLTAWLVRTAGPVDVTATLREAAREADPQLPLASLRAMTQVVDTSTSSQQFIVTLMSIFAALALVLTSVGIYGVLSYQMARRTNEIGLRMALGAQQGDVMRMIIGQGMKMTLVGIAIGLTSSFALTRFIKSLLFEVSETDPVIFIIIAVLLALVALAACYIPARRAMKVDPIIALRYE
jgi:predicted permease